MAPALRPSGPELDSTRSGIVLGSPQNDLEPVAGGERCLGSPVTHTAKSHRRETVDTTASSSGPHRTGFSEIFVD